MNQQFHTPSFGDEMFELNDTTTDQNSRRMRNLDQSSSMDEYHDTTNTTTDNATYSATTPHISNSNISLTSTAQPAATSAQPSPSKHAAQLETSQSLKKQTAIVSPLPQPATTPLMNGIHSAAISEPAKPMSAYGFFFRDSMNAIKKQKPSCTFQEISVVCANMWETLDEQQKNMYNQRHELSKQEYVIASQNYRQNLEDQQQEQQQEESVASTTNTAFTDPQPNATSPAEPFVTNKINHTPPAPTPQISAPTIAAAATTTAAPASTDVNISTNEINSQTPQQIQLLTEAAATQKCTRLNCNKPAIINPDWEDEYCSNECVIIHCRTVFSDWVKELANPTQATTSEGSSSAVQETATS